MDTKEMKLFMEKVPLLKKPLYAFFIILYLLGLISLTVLFFYFIDGIEWWSSMLSQGVMCIIVCILGILHFKYANIFRRKFSNLAYQRFFLVFMLPYLVTWYGCFFHPAFIKGDKLLPIWGQLMLVVVCLFLMISANIQIEKAGFSMVTHGMDVFTVFPEETTIVRGKIYSFIRHPLYFALLMGGFAMGFISNTWMGLVVATLQVVPCILIGFWEDKELIVRSGNDHMEYIKQTALLIPIRKLPGFLKLLLFGR